MIVKWCLVFVTLLFATKTNCEINKDLAGKFLDSYDKNHALKDFFHNYKDNFVIDVSTKLQQFSNAKKYFEELDNEITVRKRTKIQQSNSEEFIKNCLKKMKNIKYALIAVFGDDFLPRVEIKNKFKATIELDENGMFTYHLIKGPPPENILGLMNLLQQFSTNLSYKYTTNRFAVNIHKDFDGAVDAIDKIIEEISIKNLSNCQYSNEKTNVIEKSKVNIEIVKNSSKASPLNEIKPCGPGSKQFDCFKFLLKVDPTDYDSVTGQSADEVTCWADLKKQSLEYLRLAMEKLKGKNLKTVISTFFSKMIPDSNRYGTELCVNGFEHFFSTSLHYKWIQSLRKLKDYQAMHFYYYNKRDEIPESEMNYRVSNFEGSKINTTKQDVGGIDFDTCIPGTYSRFCYANLTKPTIEQLQKTNGKFFVEDLFRKMDVNFWQGCWNPMTSLFTEQYETLSQKFDLVKRTLDVTFCLENYPNSIKYIVDKTPDPIDLFVFETEESSTLETFSDSNDDMFTTTSIYEEQDSDLIMFNNDD